MSFGATEIAALATTQEAWMQDSCKVGTLATTQDSGGGPIETYTYGSEIACGVNTHLGRAARRFYDSDGTYLVADIEVRLPLVTAIAFTDRVRVTKRMGTAVTNVDYELMGVPEVGVSCIVIHGRAVST